MKIWESEITNEHIGRKVTIGCYLDKYVEEGKKIKAGVIFKGGKINIEIIGTEQQELFKKGIKHVFEVTGIVKAEKKKDKKDKPQLWLDIVEVVA